MSKLNKVPEIRIRAAQEEEVNSEGRFVLYWMIANRRLHSNYSLDRAMEWSRQLSKPLLILEALRSDYPWASDRIHAFVMQGMRDNESEANRAGVTYYPYLEPKPGAGSGLLKALAAHAAVVVTDDFPCFFLPAMTRAASRQVPCRFELVDSNGILPMRAAPKTYSRAYDFRRYLQKNLPEFLTAAPSSSPLKSAGQGRPRFHLKSCSGGPVPPCLRTRNCMTNCPDYRSTMKSVLRPFQAGFEPHDNS